MHRTARTHGRTDQGLRGRGGRSGRGTAALLAVALAGSLALTACSAGEDSAGSAGDVSVAEQEGARAAEEAPDAAPAEDGAGGGRAQDGADSASRATQVGRLGSAERAGAHLIRTAQLAVVARDAAGAYDEAVSLTETAGGYVADETTSRGRAGREHSRLTLRVPPENYSGLLADLAGLGRLTEREVTTQDVTEQVVDVESRIATQEESVERVRALMDEAQSISDVVTLESELSRRQAELESLRARHESLRQQTGMATIRLELRERRGPVEESDDDEGGPSIDGALGGGWDAFTATGLWIAAIVVAVLPFAASALLLFALWRVLRRRGVLRGPLPRRAAASGGDGD